MNSKSGHKDTVERTDSEWGDDSCFPPRPHIQSVPMWGMQRKDVVWVALDSGNWSVALNVRKVNLCVIIWWVCEAQTWFEFHFWQSSLDLLSFLKNKPKKMEVEEGMRQDDSSKVEKKHTFIPANSSNWGPANFVLSFHGGPHWHSQNGAQLKSISPRWSTCEPNLNRGFSYTSVFSPAVLLKEKYKTFFHLG